MTTAGPSNEAPGFVLRVMQMTATPDGPHGERFLGTAFLVAPVTCRHVLCGIDPQARDPLLTPRTDLLLDDCAIAAEEAMLIYRALAKARPDAFLPNFAKLLNNLGALLSELGRHDDALAAEQEAAEIDRALSAGQGT